MVCFINFANKAASFTSILSVFPSQWGHIESAALFSFLCYLFHYPDLNVVVFCTLPHLGGVWTSRWWAKQGTSALALSCEGRALRPILKLKDLVASGDGFADSFAAGGLTRDEFIVQCMGAGPCLLSSFKVPWCVLTLLVLTLCV